METRSVSERKSSCVISSAGFFATSIGLPYNTLVLPFLGIDVPIGCSLSEPMMAVGTIGQPVSSASRAAPVCPLYSRPSGLRVPSMWIPNRCPSSIISRACSSAPSDLLPPERSTGNTPTDVNHHFLNLPFNPLPSKYSALPMKCTMRGQVIGIKASSITARWLAAIIAPPSRGTLFSPLTAGLKR